MMKFTKPSSEGFVVFPPMSTDLVAGSFVHPIMPASPLETPIEYVKGVGPKRAEWLRVELGIHAAGDLLEYLPFRYEDRSKFANVSDIVSDVASLQFRGVITGLQQVGSKRGSRLVARFQDESGSLELIWF